MKFLGDIPIGRATIVRLRALGHDTISVRDRLPPNAADPEIIRLAITEERIILCFDLGFSDLVATAGQTIPSVITFRTTIHNAEYINRRLETILPEIEADLARGVLVTVEDTRVRIRPLPINRK